ncbi:hypothetical protein NXV74_25530 [Bacteroides thetaiotaomicron]|nr:hypothetical protein [Bacteroides thetaiotaomicron]
MKTKKWMMLAAGVIMTTTPLFAQFNTVMPGRTTGVSESVSLKDDDMGERLLWKDACLRKKAHRHRQAKPERRNGCNAI